MKLKLTSFHLLSVILIQIILIDIVLFVFLFGAMNRTKKEAAAVPEAKLEDGRVQENYLFYLDFTKGDPRLKRDVLKEILRKYVFIREKKRDLKLGGMSGDLVIEGVFEATAYDLSYESCGKYPSHPEYGITFSGTKAVKGRTIAVDPAVIPLGSKVHIEFSKPYTHLTGWYIAEDTGSLVKGKIVDVFFGKSALNEMERFGRRKVKVKAIPPGTRSYNETST